MASNEQCRKCGEYKTMTARSYLVSLGVITIIFSFILFFLLPVLLPTGFVLFFAGIFTSNKYWCRSCNSFFNGKEARDKPTHYCGDCKKQVTTEPYNPEYGMVCCDECDQFIYTKPKTLEGGTSTKNFTRFTNVPRTVCVYCKKITPDYIKAPDGFIYCKSCCDRWQSK